MAGLLGKYILKNFTLHPDSHIFFCRYKAAGANATDETGKPDMVEFINVAKDDALAWPKVARRSYPSATEARMASTIVPFIKKSLAVNNTLMEVFNEKLGLPEGTLAERHDLKEFSGSEARCIRSPPKPDGVTQDRATIGAHTASSRYNQAVVTSLRILLGLWFIVVLA